MPQCTVVRLPQDGDKVSPVKQHGLKRMLRIARPKLYIGLESKLPRPAGLEDRIRDKWGRVQRDDLRPYTQNIGVQVKEICQTEGIPTEDTMFEPHLLLTGSVIGSSITLSPKIWYRCNASWVLKIVRKEISGLNWTVDRGLGDRIESELEGNLRLVQATVRLPKQLSLRSGGIDLPRGHTLFVNYQDPGNTQAACGLLCSVAAKQGDDLKYHSLYRIGGVLIIRDGGGKPQNVAVTAAHGLLDHFLAAKARLPSRPRTRRTLDRSGRLPGSIVELARRNSQLSNRDDMAKSRTTELIGDVDEDKADAIKWRPVPRVHAINWLGGGWETTGHWQFPILAHSMERLASDADFALLELPSQVINTYTVGRERKMVTRLLRESEMKCGPVELILACDQVVPGTLLHDIPSLYLRGALFPTRKIQLDRPLAMGTSGSWVVQDGGLCGMIVASYTDRSFAHILTAEKLISDIKKTLGNHVEVSLPSVLPIPSSLAAVPPQEQLPIISEKASRRIPYWESDDEWYQDREGKPSIATRLRDALVQSSDQTKYFLPLDSQRDILSRESIEGIVRRCYSSSPDISDSTAVEDLCDYICGQESPHEQEPDNTARRILAVLLLVEMPSRIIDFFHERIYNSDLPLRRVDEQGASFTLARRSNTMALKCFSNWTPSRILQFDEYQWSMIAPYFKSGPDKRPLFYDFHDRIILPFVMEESLTMGGFSTIRKTKVHPAHHAFNRPELPRGPPDTFALKMIRSMGDHAMDAEMEASQILTPHPHLVKSLCSFHLLDSDYILLPWADGGNLSDAWRTDLEVPLMTARLLRWALAQCEGLAEGLATIHNPDQSLPRGAVRGLHGDVKPGNVLWFGDGGHGPFSRGYGVLKLGDFGLTRFSKGQSSTSGFLLDGFTLTYSAPDIEINSVVEQSFDIWQLGCVYLEFITWLLLGWKGVKDFAEMRSEERDRSKFRMDTFFKRSQEPLEGKATRFILKDSVDKWIRRLGEMSGCPEHLQKFLGLIEESMLQVDSKQRSSAKEIARVLRRIQTIPLSDALPESHPEDQPTLSPPQESVLLPLEAELPPDAQVSGRDEVEEVRTTTPEGSKPVLDQSIVDEPLPLNPPSPKPAKTAAPALLVPVSIKTTDEYLFESNERRQRRAAGKDRFTLSRFRRTVEREWAATNIAATGTAAAAAGIKDPDKLRHAYTTDYGLLEPEQLDAVEEELRMRLWAVEELKRGAVG